MRCIFSKLVCVSANEYYLLVKWFSINTIPYFVFINVTAEKSYLHQQVDGLLL